MWRHPRCRIRSIGPAAAEIVVGGSQSAPLTSIRRIDTDAEPCHLSDCSRG
jgi:hypothetical protein